MFLASWFLTDPWNTWTNTPPNERFSAWGAAVVTLAFGAAAFGSLAFFYVPRVLVHQDVITIINPVSQVLAPLTLVTSIDDAPTYPRIVIAGRAYRCFGLERSLSMKLRRVSDAAALARPGSAQRVVSQQREVRSTMRRLTRLELLVTSVWLALALASVLVV